MENKPKNAPLEFKTIMDVAQLVRRAFELEADDALIDSTRAFAAQPVLGISDTSDKFIKRGAAGLVEVLEKYDASDNKALWRDYLDASYAELFLGVTKECVAPQESVYQSSDKLMFAKQYFEVLEVMQTWGYEKPVWFGEPEDHLASEWSFVLYLLDKSKAAKNDEDDEKAQKADDAAHAFIKEHLLLWVEDAFKDMVERDDVGFYTSIVNIARGILPVL